MSLAPPTWEAAKENVLPTKKGRSVGKLKDSIQQSDAEAAELKQEEERFRAKLSQAACPSDKLEVYSQYVKWARTAFPQNSIKEKEVLEKFTAELKTERSLYNTTQYVAMWIEYADLVRDPAEVFSFLYTNKVGERLALFWIAYAYVAEKDGNHKVADQIFQKGIRRSAEPKELMQKKYHQFQRRIARQFLNSTEDGFSSSASASTVTSTAAVKKMKFGIQDSAISSQPSTSSLAPTTSTGLGFQIFDEAASSGSEQQSHAQWRNLGKEEERRKENQGPVLKWTNAAIPSTAPSSTSSVSIPIFVDEPFATSAPTPPVPPKAAAVAGRLSPSSEVASSSSAARPTVSSALPVASTASTRGSALPSSSAAGNNRNSASMSWMSSDLDALLAEGSEDGTINTRLAKQDIDLLFQSPGPRMDERSALPAFKDLSCIKKVIDRDSSFGPADPSFLHLLPEQNRAALQPAAASGSGLKRHFSSVATVTPPRRNQRYRSALMESFDPFSTRFVCVSPETEMQSCETAIVEASVEPQSPKPDPAAIPKSPTPPATTGKHGKLVRRAGLLLEDMEKSARTEPIGMQIINAKSTVQPRELDFRKKYSPDGEVDLPHFGQWDALAAVGRGAFGHAVLIRSCSTGDLSVAKVDSRSMFVEWEAFIHAVLRQRQKADATSHQEYLDHFLPPIAVLRFSNSSAMVLPFATHGTLIDVIAALSSTRNGAAFTSAEHEYAVAELAMQMTCAVRHIHELGIAHCDIKTDNWVLRCDANGHLKVCLIDFGKSRLCKVCAGCSQCSGSTDLIRAHEEALREHEPEAPLRSVYYAGNVAAKGYNVGMHQERWMFQPDYVGLCACVHQLLFFELLVVVEAAEDTARRRGFHITPEIAQEKVLIPQATLRRYWSKPCWSKWYLDLLNSDGLQLLLDWAALQNALQTIVNGKQAQCKETLVKLARKLKSSCGSFSC